MMPGMSDDYSRPDTGQPDMSPHNQTPDVSLDNAVSIREAATRANVTEKTIRRWIKSNRLHAVKLGGQYRITLADLERAVDMPDVSSVHPPGTHDWGSGHSSPRGDMSKGLDTEQAEERQVVEPLDLAPLVDHIAGLERQVQQLTEAATGWQIRARQAEDRLEVLTAGETAPDIAQEAVGSSERDDTGPPGVWDRLRRWLSGG